MPRCIVVVRKELGKEEIQVLPLLAGLVCLSWDVVTLQLGKIINVDIVARDL